jgi:cell fate (sporulation/competence/biofilm development) regulator YlbF (YheA/YmcA/DUF963 family)
MNVQPILNLPATHEKVEQAAIKLGDLLHEHPLYQTYQRSFIDLEEDAQVRKLSIQIQTKRNALYGGKSGLELTAELQRLNQDLESLPAIQAYHAAESDVRSFLSAVNALLSDILKVDFAANAKRGCGCGG